MAKLNITIPAVDVLVNGMAYRKVDRKAQAGDIVKVISSDYDMEYGGFYPVGDGPSVVDDVSDRIKPFSAYPEDFEVYAPVSSAVTVDPPAAPSDEITYGGAVYRKVERDARKGDVIILRSAPFEEYDVTKGTPYEVTRVDAADDPHVDDETGIDYDTTGDRFDVYEKVAEESAPAPTLPAVEYREVKRWAEKGERIRIVSKHNDRYDNGDELVVDAPAGSGDVFVKHPQGMNEGRACVSHVEYVVLEPFAQPTVYVEVKRKANVGERIRIVNPTGASGYGVGDEGEVTEVCGGSGAFAEMSVGRRGLFHSEYVVLEPVPAQVISEPKRYAAGDYVKVTGNSVCHSYEVGSVVKITHVEKSHGYGQRFNAEAADGTVGNWLVLPDVEPADGAAFEAAKAELQKPQPKAPEPEFSVGDLVKVTTAGTHFAKAGDILRIFEFVDYGPNGIHCEKLDGDRPMCGFFYGRELTKLSAEEAVAIGKEAQEIAKWNAIGRKVGEYKTGDIVEVTSASGLCVGDKINVGDIVVLGDKDESDGMFRLQAPGVIGGNWASTHRFKLVAPVEQRFDTEQAA